ncbi:HIT domain-containing protein [Nitrosopumilus sp.]|jgi:histidine triad (HIT) family protein|nr:HIT domain-containing protein [Nitrosopumilus sp.]|tara:strand:+ start:62 stop:469 length:408 start_codon:yes stop_codon:yes gene_type:complete
MVCIFCDILDGKREGHIVYEDENHIAFLDKYPIDDGHTLVIPKKHYGRITDMDSKDVGNIFSLIPKIAKAVLSGTGADAFSLAQNNGKAAKQIIPHVHIHIIPRYNEKGTVWTKRQIPSDDILSTLAEKIKSSFI